MAEFGKHSEIALCLNELTKYNLRNIATDDHLKEVINDYFCSADDVNDELSEISDDDSDDGKGRVIPSLPVSSDAVFDGSSSAVPGYSSLSTDAVSGGEKTLLETDPYGNAGV